jgi:parvulin-like peptidyl-prolyl isomerase
MYFKFKLIPSLVLTILSAILILFNCPEIHCQSNNQGVAAIVDGHIITVDQVTELSTQLGGKGILNQLIGNKLVDHAAQKAGITIADSEIDSNLKHVSDTISPQTIDQYLSQRHITLKEFRNYLRVQLEIRKLLQPKLPAIQMVHVRDILINIRPQGQLPAPNDHMHSLKEAQAISSQILIRLKKGENFAKLASHYSEDIANNSSGGDIGIVTNISGVGTTAAVRAFGRDPNFSNAIFSMQVGQISSSPIQSVFGLHIVDILSTSDKPLSSDTSLYEQEYQVAQSAQLQNASHDYLNQLASSANITYFPYEPSAAQKGSAATVDGDPIPTIRTRLCI